VWNWLQNLGELLSGPVKVALNVAKGIIDGVVGGIRLMISAVEKAIDLWNSLKRAIQGVGGNPLAANPTRPNAGSGYFGPAGQNSNEILVAPSAQYVVDEEAVARAIYAILMRSDGRNGTPVFG